MAYQGRTLPPAPLPPPSPISRTLNNRYHQQQYLPTLEPNGFSNQNSIRSQSISNVSRVSNSTDSATMVSSSSSSSSANIDNESMTPHSMSPTSRLLDEFETSKIEMFYRSHRAFVYVGQCLVSLLFTETELVDGGRQSRPKSQDWKQVCNGVPVLLFNRGDTRSRDKRQIRICIAEHGTGFQLWSDVIDNLSNYQALKPTFHTMYLSMDHRKMAGLQFENQFAALEFYRQIEIIVANPLNISLTGPKAKKSTEKFKLFRRQRSKSVGRSSDIPRESSLYDGPDYHSKTYHQKNRTPKGKSDISAPCLFQHVTSVNLNNFDKFDSTMVHESFNEKLKQVPDSLEHNVYKNVNPNRIRSDYSTPFPYHSCNHSTTTTSSTSA